jgi:hypothetical protein
MARARKFSTSVMNRVQFRRRSFPAWFPGVAMMKGIYQGLHRGGSNPADRRRGTRPLWQYLNFFESTYMPYSAQIQFEPSRRINAGRRLLLLREPFGPGTKVSFGVPLAMMTAIALLVFTAGSARGQGTTGTYGNLIVTGTLCVPGAASVGTLAVTGTTAGTGLDIEGDSLLFGSWSTNSLQPGVTYSYSEASGGTNAAFTTTLTRPVSTWSWLRLDGSGNAWNVMALDGSNQLILTGTQTSTPGSIIIDPTAGQITINGQTVPTTNQLQNLAISSASLGAGNTVGGSSIGVGSNVTASGTDSSAFGFGSTASGAFSFAAGVGTTAQAYASLVLGAYNSPSGNGSSWVTTDPLFTIGNGTSGSTPSNALTVLKNGNVGIATTTPDSRLEISANTSAGPSGLPNGTLIHLLSANGVVARQTFDSFGISGAGSVFEVRSAEGTAASPTASLSGDILGQYIFDGYGTTNFGGSGRAKILAIADQNWSDTAQGTNLTFQTTADNTTTTSEAMRITSTGKVGIATPTPLSTLDINGSIATGTYAGTTAAPVNGMIVSGSVGIATSSPQATLDVGGPVMVSGSGSAVLINPQGDLSMGPFTSGTIPQ